MSSKDSENVTKTQRMTRRDFLGGSAAAAAALSMLPGNVLGGAGRVGPNNKITIASIGVGAQGTRVMMDFLKIPDVQVVAVCDVNRETSDYSEWGKGEILAKERKLLSDSSWGSDWKGPTCGREPARRLVDAYYSKVRNISGYKGCTAYNDFRDLLAKEKDLDGVVVCTPDHWHAGVSIYAMRHGKHVFCQKAMAHTIYEARLMAQVARETKVATQVAVMNEASDATRLLTEWVAAGVIGQVREVHNWSQRPYWPQGIDHPKQSDPVPDGFDWDLWLGPAQFRPFNHAYLPFVWRGWFDFGEGAIGDMGNYSFDTMFRVLKLTSPAYVEASSTPRFPETYPVGALMHWEFPEREGRAPVVIHWYDGDLRPPRPKELAPGEHMSHEDGEGMLFVGDQGKILCGFEGQKPRLIPDSRMKEFERPPDNLPKSPGAYREWLNAIRGAEPPRANFEFEQKVVESVLLGSVAVRMSSKLKWDPANMRVTGLAEGNAGDLAAANAQINAPRRAPWKFA
ncbi:MAG: Gfo/Idh/MocA family protein [Terriglobia bacterium]